MERIPETWGIIPTFAEQAIKTVVRLVRIRLEELSIEDQSLADKLATEIKESHPFDSLPNLIASRPEIFLAGLELNEASDMLSALGRFNPKKTFSAIAAIKGYMAGLETPRSKGNFPS